ncbi:COR domain-containing protein [Actinoplanes sp. NPDC049596]|uniref:leucine-rich repeat domain-containing protein n=1 Tax=unclassified Actinoplanes TaxID=2626549 RepID=UPI00343D825A
MSSAEDRVAEAIASGATEINLAYTGLTEVPAVLRELTGITRLDLSYNRIGELPEWIAEMSSLTELDLNHNDLGTVPPVVSDLTGLRGLGLLGNRLTGLPAELHRLTGLRWLALRGNQFAAVPEVLRELGRLELLDLRHSSITELPDWIAELSRLRDLNLADAALTGLPGTIGRLTDLRRLDLRGNHLTGLPAGAASLSRLESLWLSRNRLTDLPGAVRGMTALTGLAIRDNQLTTVPAWIGELNNLTWLAVAGNRLTEVPAALGDLPRLTELDLAGNDLTTVPGRLGDRVYEVFDLSDNPLDPALRAACDAGPAELSAYLRLLHQDSEEVREAKLILVGEGDVGKSCLLGALRDEAWRSRDTTHGIEIKPLDVRDGDGPPLRLNGWDFSGQKEYRPTHQLFFTAPAVYLVVWKPRVGVERSYVHYWIDLIRNRVGASARIIVVATHRSPDEPAALLDQAELTAEFGNLICGFHHVDSRSGNRIGELSAHIARVAAALPGVQRRYPRSWQTFRAGLKRLDAPYLRYHEYEQRAGEAGLGDSAALLARIANRLGQWITFGDSDSDPDAATDLVILKPDWLSTAISLVLNDEQTYAAKGLLPHRRLPEIWNDPNRRHHYPPRLFPAFLALMQRFELSYPVTDPTRGGEQISLIPLLLAATRPDLSVAWNDYRPDWPRASQVCEITEDDGGPARLPEGLMCRLIARFHPYSLGLSDVRDSVHWLNGMVLQDSYQGRALVEARDNLIWVTVSGVSPGFLLYRLTDEIRQVVDDWKGFQVTVKVPCRTCPPGQRNRGLFAIRLLLRIRETHPELHCLTCGEPQVIDELLTGVSPAQLDRRADARTAAELRQVVREELEPLAELIAGIGPYAERALQSLGRTQISHLVARDELFLQLLEALDDEVRDGPWLAGIDKLPATVLRPGWTRARLRLSLWCEHARLPLSVLRDDPGAGVYELEVPRDWLIKAAPYLRVGLALLRTFTPIVGEGLDDVLSDTARQTLGDQLKAAGESLEPMLNEAASYHVLEAAPGDRAASAVAVDRAERPDAAVLRGLQQLIADQDKTFAGLVRVRNHIGGRLRYQWVDARFVPLYRN